MLKKCEHRTARVLAKSNVLRPCPQLLHPRTLVTFQMLAFCLFNIAATSLKSAETPAHPLGPGELGEWSGPAEGCETTWTEPNLALTQVWQSLGFAAG